MIKWSLAAELLALIIIIFLMLHYHDRRLAANYRRNMYRLCLWMSAAAIILNIICVSVISLSDKVPVWVNLLFNSAYFIQVVLLCSVVAAYLSSLILEHVYEEISYICCTSEPYVLVRGGMECKKRGPLLF